MRLLYACLEKKTVRLDLYLWLIIQILITFSQVLASFYLARYVEYHLTCVFVV